MSLAISVESLLTPATLAPAHDPPDLERDVDVDALGENIAALAARLHAVTYELLVLLGQFDARAGWNNGFMSCAHWLHWRTGINVGAAREKIRVARALPALPLISRTMASGQLSYAKVRALTRVATPANERTLLDFALAGTAAHVERLTRAWRRVDEAQAGHDDNARHLRRQLSTWLDDDGMVVIRGRLSPEVGAVVLRALEAASDRLFRDGRSASTGNSLAEEVTPAQRRADALGLLAETALSAGLDGGSAGDRYQVFVHVTAGPQSVRSGDDANRNAASAREVAAPAGADPAHSALELDHGAIGVSAETSRRLACDASVVRMDHAEDGRILDVGRKTRTIPPSIRRALAARDRQCRFPGCTSRRCDAHHIEHWADGGATSVDNLLLLCRRHHRAVHEGGFGVFRDAEGQPRFLRPDGQMLAASPGLPSTAVMAQPAPGRSHSAIPVWDGARLDMGWALDILHGRHADLDNENEDEDGCGSCGNRSLVAKELVGALPA